MWALYEILARLLNIYQSVILIYIIMSWFPGARESTIGRLISTVVEPYLEPFRKVIPPILGMIDISPIVAIFVLQLAQTGLFELFQLIT